MNPNTNDYWDEQFEKEWKVINTVESARGDSGYRWDNIRFGIIGTKTPFRGRLLDIGCGLGNFCRFIKARNPFLKVYGVDFSPKGIEIAKQIEPLIDYRIAEATKLPFPDKYFTTISAQEIIEHLSNPLKAIREWKRVLRPGGRLFITTPWRGAGDYRYGTKFASIEHVQEWKPKEFAKIMFKYFGKEVELVFPPAFTDVVSQETNLPVWFMTICTK